MVQIGENNWIGERLLGAGNETLPMLEDNELLQLPDKVELYVLWINGGCDSGVMSLRQALHKATSAKAGSSIRIERLSDRSANIERSQVLRLSGSLGLKFSSPSP